MKNVLNRTNNRLDSTEEKTGGLKIQQVAEYGRYMLAIPELKRLRE